MICFSGHVGKRNGGFRFHVEQESIVVERLNLEALIRMMSDASRMMTDNIFRVTAEEYI